MDGVNALWLLLPLLLVSRRCDCSFEQKRTDVDIDDFDDIDFADENDRAESRTEKFSSDEFLARKEFEEKKHNIILFGLHATRNKTIDRRNVIKVLRLSKVPFEDDEVQEVVVLQKDRRYPNAPIMVKFTSSQLQRAIMYRKHNYRRTLFRIEFDLTKKTLNKQKRLLPLRRYLKRINITAFIKLGKIVVRNKVLNSDEADRLATEHGVPLGPRITDGPSTNATVARTTPQTTVRRRFRWR